jgi:glycosyltransferase involved in cell wall biosynthesis
MRVAHFIQRYPPALGGSESYFARLSRFLAAQGDEVTVFSTTALDLEAFWSCGGRRLLPGATVADGIEVRRFAPAIWPGRRYMLKALSLFPSRLWQCLTLPCNPIALGMWSEAGQLQQTFHLVHATAFPYAWPIVCGLRLARRLNVPFLVTPFLHLGDSADARNRIRRAYLSRALRALLDAADCVFVQTSLERTALLDEGIAEDKLVLLGMGVDAAECTGGNRERARAAWGVKSNEIVIGHLANNSVEKGTVDLLRAAERAWQRGRRFQLVLAGPEMPNFRRFWDRHVLSIPVQRRGILNEQQKRDFFAGIDLFALPSRSDSFGLVLLEAWANGVPNVGYRAGGVAEVIRHQEDGLLVSCGDVEGLAKALGELVEDTASRQRLGAAGLARTQTEFRWEDKLCLVRAVYNELSLKRQRRGFADASGSERQQHSPTDYFSAGSPFRTM